MALTRRKTKKVVKRYWPLGIAGLVAVAMVFAWIALPVPNWTEALSSAVARMGALGPLLYFVLYVLGTTVLAPSPLMSIAAGVAFGWWGLPLAILSATAGAACSFLLARYFFDEAFEDWLMDRPVFKAAKRAVDAEGWWIILLLRLSPVIPFGLLNYMLGLTKTSLVNYLILTAIGIVPGTVIDIYIGVVGTKTGNTAQFAYLVIGLIATAMAGIMITIKARFYLKKAGVNV